MLTFCKKCGKKNHKSNFNKSVHEISCDYCGYRLIENKPDKIYLECESCSLGQHVDMYSFDGWSCKSCLHPNKHPAMEPIVGNGNAFHQPSKKTTFNFEVLLLEAIDDRLEEINKTSPYKLKRGAFIRLILKQKLGITFLKEKRVAPESEMNNRAISGAMP